MLYYYRCEDCLSAMTALDPHLDAHCICGGALESLGQVRDNSHAVETVELPVCDGRCTSAQGNSCRCVCGGKNHGTHLTVSVEIDNGKAVVRPAGQDAILRGNTFRSLVDRAWSALKNYDPAGWARLESGEWIERGLWLKLYYTHKEIYGAMGLRSHSGRVKRLNAIISTIDGWSRPG